MNDDDLNDLFARARTPDAPGDGVNDALFARIMADADAELARRRHAAPRAPFLATLRDVFGGWPSLGGLAAATLAGVWIGVAPPAPIDDLAATLRGDTIDVSLMTFDAFTQLEDGS